MKHERRVLLIEDMTGSRKTYTEVIQFAGYSVDAVATLEEAIWLLDRKTYHVAVVDITLDVEDIYNRDGLTIIEYIFKLKEGTEAIILSGQPEVDVAVDAFERFNLVRYLKKSRLKRPADLTSAVDEAYNKCKIREFGDFGSAFQFLSGKEDDMHWTCKSLEVLRPTVGVLGLSEFFERFLAPFTPLFPRNGVLVPMSVNKPESSVSGEFWSKLCGFAVSLVAYPKQFSEGVRENEDPDITPAKNLIFRYEKANVLGLAYTLPGCERNEFVKRMPDGLVP